MLRRIHVGTFGGDAQAAKAKWCAHGSQRGAVDACGCLCNRIRVRLLRKAYCGDVSPCVTARLQGRSSTIRQLACWRTKSLR